MEVDPKDAAQAQIEGCPVKVGQWWQHYKGGLYSVVALSIDEATLVPLVTYRSLTHGTTWTRTLEVFTGYANLGTPRFARTSALDGATISWT